MELNPLDVQRNRFGHYIMYQMEITKRWTL